MKHFLSAIKFITILPGGRSDDFDPARMTPFFPAVGLVLGALVAGFDWAATHLWGLSLVSLLDVVLLAILSGAFHIDGLGDAADGLFSHRSRARMLEIMKDSRVGVMGRVAIGAALADANTAPDAVSFVNAHGTATVFNDLMEAKAFHLVFGARAAEVPINSIKGAIGHTMGAAGALEAILCALVLRNGQAPPTAGLRQLDPEIALDVVQDAPRAGAFRCAVSTSSGFGGVNAALVFLSPDHSVSW